MKITKNGLAALVAGFALVASSFSASLTSEVRSRYNQFRTAVERFDVAAVRQMVEPGFEVTLPDGQVISRATYLAGLADRKAISVGTGTHKFTIESVRERKGLVTAKVVLTLTSKFRDGNQAVHTLQTVERKTVIWTRDGSNLKLARINATEVRTIIDGKQVSVLR